MKEAISASHKDSCLEQQSLNEVSGDVTADSPETAQCLNESTADCLIGTRLNYLNFKDFLVRLGLLTESQAMRSDSEERGLLFELWKLLEGEKTESISAENLRVAVQVVLRLIDPHRVKNVDDSLSCEAQSKKADVVSSTESGVPLQFGREIGFLNKKGLLCFSMNEVPRIQGVFKLFYTNRLQFVGKQLESKKDQKIQSIIKQESQFKPQIAKSSYLLAEKRKKKIAQQIGIDSQKIEESSLDSIELLRAQGQLSKLNK